jgi:signal transduction histidine kinase
LLRCYLLPLLRVVLTHLLSDNQLSMLPLKGLKTMIPTSIRWRLPLSYAAIALLATLSLGVVLLTTLRSYTIQRELDYLTNNARAISVAMTYLLETEPSPDVLQARLRSFSFLSQTRVRLLDESGTVVADSLSPQERRARVGLFAAAGPDTIWSAGAALLPGNEEVQDVRVEIERLQGSPGDIDPDQIEHLLLPSGESEANTVREDIIIVVNDAPNERVITRTLVTTANGTTAVTRSIARLQSDTFEQPLPDLIDPIFFTVAGTPYGFELDAELAEDGQRSDQSVRRGFYDLDGGLNTIELSEGPAYGRQILTSVARGWAIASGVAVVLAAGAGWLVSRQLSTPLLALTRVTTTMAEGDLSARADVSRRDELGRLARSYNDMANRVEETVIALRRFVADAAHELQTPLTALNTDLELIAAGPDDGERRAFVERAQTQVRRLETLTTGLLELSRLEAGASPTPFTPIDLAALIRDMSERYASRAEQAGLSFELDLPAEATMVRGNQGQLYLAISNLLDNALKFTPAGGAVKVKLQTEPDHIELSVEDTGIGLRPEDLPQLFSRFHRGRNAAAYPGSGLGLAIVKTIVEGRGGQVSAENTGHGARFVVRAPF